MELNKEQLKLLEKALNVASDKFTYTEFSQDEMKLIYDAQHLVKNLTIPIVINCPFCGSDDIFKFELTHYNCRKCKERYTNAEF